MAKKDDRLIRALLETARDMHEGGLLNQEAYAKITLRHLGKEETPKFAPLTLDTNSAR